MAAVLIFLGGSLAQAQTKLTASDGAAGDEFSISVAGDGDIAVVGAPRDDGPSTNTGSAYVYLRDGAAWGQEAKLTAGDVAQFAEFGISVAVSGDTAAVGAWGDDDLGAASGSVYVFTRTGGVWAQQAKLTATDATKTGPTMR